MSRLTDTAGNVTAAEAAMPQTRQFYLLQMATVARLLEPELLQRNQRCSGRPAPATSARTIRGR
jgi:hypothetical protein